MWLRLRLLVLVALAVAGIQSALAQSSPSSDLAAAPVPRRVITWVQPYNIANAKAQLIKTYSGSGPRTGLTHLALQFWTLNANGALVRSTAGGTISNQTINWFVTWAHNNHIKVILCVYNGEHGWDWPLAQNAFTNHRAALIAKLVQQVTAFKLDGVDVDLEGPSGVTEPTDPAYNSFVRGLAVKIHALENKKTVTIDSFAAEWSSPNWNWWAALFPYIDGINSMGYVELGRNPPTVATEPWRSYANQKAHAGAYSSKLNIGLPSTVSTWQGNKTLQQIQWFKLAEAKRVGIAIWDAQFPDASWQTAPVWNTLNYIKTH